MPAGGNFTACNCGPDTAACEDPTQPMSTTGLCLADGTPIAVAVVRDCAGSVTSEGWINLTTGAWTTGAPPAGTIACGDSRSITTTGTFCDIDADSGDVLGLVLVEYQYAADGSIAAVRLVDAVTGDTYTPKGDVTTCPAGVEQPERDLVQLCDTNDDESGTIQTTPFLRDYARDENGAIVGHTDYTLDGEPYTVAGTVGVCPQTTDCRDCQTHILCDTGPEPVQVGPNAHTGTLSNGVGYAITGANSLLGQPWFLLREQVQTWAFTETVRAEWGVQLRRTGDCLVLPEGTVPVSVAPVHTYDPATRTLCLTGPSDDTSFSTFSHPGAEVLTFTAEGAIPYVSRRVGLMTVGPASQPFQRTTCRDCQGAVVEVTDTLLDGTPYTPTGTVGLCQPESTEPCRDTATVLLCDETSDRAWTQVSVDPDPSSPAGQGWLFRLSPDDDPSTIATVRVTTSTPDTGSCASNGPRWYNNGTVFVYELDAVAQTFPTLRLNILDFDTNETLTMLDGAPDRLEGNAYTTGGGVIRSNLNNATGYLLFDQPPATLSYRFTGACTNIAFDAVSSRTTQFLRKIVTDCDTGETVSVTDTDLAGQPYTPTGDVGQCQTTGGAPEPCRNTSTTLLCDTAATDVITVFDPANVAGSDGWEVVSFTGANAGFGPEGPMPYPAPHGSPRGYPALGARADQSAGSGGSWPGYDTAPVRWVLRKTFQAPEDGVAVAQSVGFRGDGGARVRINGMDAGMYGQWNQPATSGTAQIPVTAGPNVVEIEVRDTSGINNVVGRLDIAMPRTVQFMRRQVVDCETGDVIATHDTTLDGEPYEVVGEVGQCETLGGECCEPLPPETRVDVETALLCVRDQAGGDILGQVIAERVYDDQTGDLVEQRLTDLDGAAFTLPDGAELAKCPNPDRIVRTICLARQGTAEFLTNAANASTGVDADWVWSPEPTGPWHPMHQVVPSPAWTVTDTAPNAAHWVAPHADRTVCPTAGETSPPVPGTWYTRASWNLPADVDPDTIRISASVLNADNGVVRWRLNDGPWQPVTGGGFTPPAWTFPPTAVPGGRPGQNEVIVQVLETAPAVTCPSPNQAGMMLHVTATYRHEPETWTQVIETGGQVYYLDQDGQRQDAIPDGYRQVLCGGGDGGCCPPEARSDIESDVLCIRDADGEIGHQVLVERVYDDQSGTRTEQRLTDLTTGEEVELPDGAELVLCQEPPCPTAFSTECVGVVTRTEAGYDNTSTIDGVPGKCGSVQGPGGQFPCQPTGPLTITSWIVDGEEVIGEGGGKAFNGGPCGAGTPGNLGMHHNWALALTNLDPGGATWSAQQAPGCAWYVGSTGGTRTVYGPMTIVDTAGQQWILGPAQACEEVQFTKVYTQQCDGAVSVSWLDAEGVETDAPEGDQVPCGTGCGTGGGRGADTETLTLCDVPADGGDPVPFLRHITYGSAGQVSVVIDTGLDGVAPYTPSGTVTVCQPDPGGQDVELLAMCVLDNATGRAVQEIVAEIRFDTETGQRTGVTYVDPLTWGPVALPGGTHIGLCPGAEPAPDVEVLTLCDLVDGEEPVPFLRHITYPAGATAPVVTDTTLDGTTPYAPAGTVGTCAAPPAECRQTSTVELCDLAVTETVTVLDPTSVLGPDGWQVTSFTGAQPGYGPDGTIPYDAHHRISSAGVGQLSSRADFSMGPPTVPWPGYDDAPMAWVLSKTFTLSVGGTAKVVVDGFKGDHGARVRINGQDLGLYAQYNQPVDGGVFEVPVNAGANLIEIEDHDINNVSYIQGRITVTVSGSTRFLRHYVLDCESGEVLSFTDTTVDGDPYTVVGEVGQCTLPVEGQGDGGTGTPCMAQSVIEQCRYDDTDGDGVADVTYVELYGVGCDGAVTPLGAFTEDLSEPYTPVSPVVAEDEAPPTATYVEPHRVELGAGESWDASSVTLLQSVTATAHGGTGQITTAAGTSTLFEGESVSWSVIRDDDTALTGPLTIAAGPGIVTVSYTRTTAS
ncbi:hypothetical protein [Streptomyces sp. AD55]|uniref:hypothetical protein n=1 Tax=Streptomyces sp. AD55 TaxID=3242895 RepID=UPI003527B7A9